MMRDDTRGLWLGFLGVVIFALTLPMTRLATGSVDAPQLSPWFVTWARAALAGGLPPGWQVEIALVWEPPWSPALMSERTRQNFGW